MKLISYFKDMDDESRARWRFAAGALVVAIAVFTTISVVSYFFTWKLDASSLAAGVTAGTEVSNSGASLGARWWPWNVYSSWWFGARGQVEEYNRGIQAPFFGRNLPSEEGLAAGLGLASGYSRMLSAHWNLDIGVGLWAGRSRYTRYRCPRCGRILSDTETGRQLKDRMKWFILPSNETQVSLIYVF